MKVQESGEEENSDKIKKTNKKEKLLDKKNQSQKLKESESPKNINHIGAPVKDSTNKKEKPKEKKSKSGWWSKG